MDPPPRLMRIAFLLNSFPALSETFVLNQITGLLDRGHDVQVFAGRRVEGGKVHPDVQRYGLMERARYAPRTPSRRLWRPVKGIGLLAASGRRAFPLLRSCNPWRYGWSALSFSHVYRVLPWLATGEFDVVHCHFGPNGLAAVDLRDLGVLGGAAIVTTYHGYDATSYVRAKGRSVYRRLFEEGDAFLPISEWLKRRLLELGCDEQKIRVHHMGVDLGRLAFRPRRRLGNEPVRIISVGRLAEKKGFEYAVAAVAAARRSGLSAEYTIVGDGPLRSRIERQIVESELGLHVRLAGQKDQSEVTALLDRAHLFLAPSITAPDGDQEGIPVSLMEAMAVGLPVVSTLHSGIPELVEDGVSGFLVPERDVTALAAKVCELAGCHEDWTQIGAAGRARIAAEFEIRALNDRLVEVYVDSIERYKRRMRNPGTK